MNNGIRTIFLMPLRFFNPTQKKLYKKEVWLKRHRFTCQ
jgi:hypothetical protein